VRLDLVQANDAAQFAENQSEAQQVLRRRRAAATRTALVQPPGIRAPLSEQVSLLWALQRGFLDQTEPEQIPVRSVRACVRRCASNARSRRLMTPHITYSYPCQNYSAETVLLTPAACCAALSAPPLLHTSRPDLAVQAVWGGLWEELQSSAADALEQIESTKKLTAVSERALQDACESHLRTVV